MYELNTKNFIKTFIEEKKTALDSLKTIKAKGIAV